VLNPVNLIALALLATPKHTADERALLRMIEHYQALARERRTRRAASPALERKESWPTPSDLRSSSVSPTRWAI
jgi:glycerol-3-phosphate O-acyltransferase